MLIRIAIVGCGAIAEDMHLPAVHAVPGVALAALVDSDVKRAQKLADKCPGAKAASRLAELKGEVDAVILATPPHIRPALAAESFALGCHVFCEKPMANTAAECRQIIAAAEAAGKVLAVGHNYRFWPARLAVKQLLDEKRFGRVIELDLTEGKPYTWQPVSGYTMRKEMVPGGVLINAGIHTVDALLWWLGLPDSFEYEDDACGGLESNVRLRLQYPGAVQVSYRLSRTCQLENLIRIHCEQAIIQLSVYGRDRYQIIKHGAGTEAICAATNSAADQSAQVQLADFIAAIQTGKPPAVGGQAGLEAVRLIEDSYQAKRRRPLPEKAPMPGLTW